MPLAGVGLSVLVLRGSFRRVEHILLALSAVFVAYILAGFLAHPDWGATAKGLVVTQMPLNRDAVLVAVATVGTTLAPWGLAFIQSYAVDKRLHVKDLRSWRVDVIAGAVMTGVIGLFVVVACAATLHVQGTTINDAGDAAEALKPLAGHLASTLFGLGRFPRPAGSGDSAALDGLFGCRVSGYSLRHQRQLSRGTALLLQLRRRGDVCRSPSAHPRGTADPDTLSYLRH